MGQVRVKRSKPKIQPRSRENPTRRRCEWIRNASFYCNGFAGKIKPSSFWPKWRSFTFPCSPQETKSDNKLSDSPVNQVNRPATEPPAEEEKFKISTLLASPSSTPPMNAFLLTRSRSAPFSSSSLAFRFWEENNRREAESRNEREQTVRSANTIPGVPSGATGKVNGVNESASNVREEVELGFVRRPELTRSKSAPARIGEKMVCFWMRKKVRQGLGSLSRDSSDNLTNSLVN
ncbi:hypothetical protein Rs2_12538 [Raphanus sativus]|nr:hypothetical protein Rs2_12538 [Raphanus sativus]